MSKINHNKRTFIYNNNSLPKHNRIYCEFTTNYTNFFIKIIAIYIDYFFTLDIRKNTDDKWVSSISKCNFLGKVIDCFFQKKEERKTSPSSSDGKK